MVEASNKQTNKNPHGPHFILSESDNEVHSFKLMYLPFAIFSERTQSPVTGERLPHNRQSIIPRSSVSTDSFEEENRQEACSSSASSGERDEDSLSLTLRGENAQKIVSKTSKQ
ncbi:Hypothetical predicted protein, partial [Marmota monax]